MDFAALSPDLGFLMLAAHLAGDFIGQNHYHQTKSKDSLVCTAHVAVYSIGFLLLASAGLLPWWAVLAVAVQHWLQDRFALHVKWMHFYCQTPVDKWPVGPLCVDQAFHLVFLATVRLLPS